MKTLAKITLVIAMLATAAITNADMVSGYFRSDGTYVMPYYRTPANGIPYDNLSYRGYPSQESGYVSPRNFGLGSNLYSPRSDFRLPSQSSPFKALDTGLKTLPRLPGTYKIRTFGY